MYATTTSGASYPYCYFSYTASCDAAKVAMRYSFLKTEPVRDFAPVLYDDNKMGRFGYFRVERYSHQRRRGLTETGRVRMAAIHNIWKQTYERDANGSFKLEAVTNDQDETIATGALRSRWKTASQSRSRITSPPISRKLSRSTPTVGDSWNGAYRRTVAAALGYQSAREDDAALASPICSSSVTTQCPPKCLALPRR